jgi:hypothetical protein
MMDAMAHHPGFWDDELEQLSSDAVGVLGEDAVSAAIQAHCYRPATRRERRSRSRI